MNVIAINKKARFDYHVHETFEAGIVLTGDEVKAIRNKQVSLVDAFATVHEGEINLINCYIAPYSHAYTKGDQTRRTRKLLLKRREINKLIGAVSKKGYTLVPLKLYINQRGLVKVEIATATHRKKIDKKRALKERDIKREASREVKQKIR